MWNWLLLVLFVCLQTLRNRQSCKCILPFSLSQYFLQQQNYQRGFSCCSFALTCINICFIQEPQSKCVCVCVCARTCMHVTQTLCVYLFFGRLMWKSSSFPLPVIQCVKGAAGAVNMWRHLPACLPVWTDGSTWGPIAQEPLDRLRFSLVALNSIHVPLSRNSSVLFSAWGKGD